MYLNVSRIGKSIQSTEPLLVSHSTNAVPPSKITLELNGLLLSGAVLEYPRTITKEMLRLSFNSEFARFEKQMSTNTVYIWRDENRKFAALVGSATGSVNMVVRSADKSVQPFLREGK